MTHFEQIKILFESELYQDAKLLASILLTMSENNPELLPMPSRYQTMMYHADALYQLGEYKRAEHWYRKALQMKKVMNKNKAKSSSVDLVSDVSLKYKLHLCYSHLKQYREAIVMLESISSKQRSSKVNMALAKLYQRTGMDRSAITGYKEVLRECPLSLEAAIGLLQLGVKGAEVISLIMNGLPNTNSMEWVLSWVKCHAYSACREYSNAIMAFQTLDSKTMLRDNGEVLCSLGEAKFLNGDYIGAIDTLQRVHALNPLLLTNMEILAYLLYHEKRVKELESFANQLMSVTESAPQPWVAMGYFCMATRKSTRAVYFAQKAFVLDNRILEALILKGSALLDLKKIQEAIMHFREALRLSPHRYEAHKGLVDCYVLGHRTWEAITWAIHAYKQLGTNARSLTLYASVLAKEYLSIEKAKTYLEKAMKLDPSYLESVYALSDILSRQQQYDKGIELLRRQLVYQSSCRLHQMLGDFLSHNNEHQEALDQYSIALSLDPTNVRAREGMERVEKQSDMGLECAYDAEVDDMEGTDNEADLEGSDIESAWSDIDLG